MGLYWDNGKENGSYCSMLGLYWGYIGIMEKKMETTVVYWGIQLIFYLGDTMVPNNGESNGKGNGNWGYIGFILGFGVWSLCKVLGMQGLYSVLGIQGLR